MFTGHNGTACRYAPCKLSRFASNDICFKSSNFHFFLKNITHKVRS